MDFHQLVAFLKFQNSKRKRSGRNLRPICANSRSAREALFSSKKALYQNLTRSAWLIATYPVRLPDRHRPAVLNLQNHSRPAVFQTQVNPQCHWPGARRLPRPLMLKHSARHVMFTPDTCQRAYWVYCSRGWDHQWPNQSACLGAIRRTALVLEINRSVQTLRRKETASRH